MPGTALACGLATVDVVQVVETVPGPDEKVVARASSLSAGGPACTAAMTCALLGIPTRFLGAIGSGALSSVVLGELAGHGVAVTDLAPAGFEPPLSTVLVTESTGERAVVSRNAVGTEGYRTLSAAGLAPLLDGVGALLVDGHHLPLAVPVAREARRLGVQVLLDAGSWKPGLEDLLPFVDVLVASADFHAPGGDSLQDLLALGPGWVARSAGPRPVRWAAADGAAGTVDVPSVTVVDTLGAGDVLHGALLSAMAETGLADLPGALRRAVAVASRSVQAVGALGWSHGR